MKILDELEKLANEATPGPWKLDYSGFGGDDGYPQIESLDGMWGLCGDNCMDFADAAYLCRCDPQTIKKLIAVVRAAFQFSNEPCFCDDDQDGLCRACVLDKKLAALEQSE